MGTTADTWVASSGDWSAPTNWSGGVPGTLDNASFATSAAITVTFTATDTIAQLLEPANPGATLVLDGGALTLLDGGIWDGVFVLAPSAELAVSSQTFTLAGLAELDGIVAGPGTVSVAGFAQIERSVFTGSAVLQDLGTVVAVGVITLGTSAADSATLAIGAGATFAILGDSSIQAAGTATIINAGLFAKSGPGGTSFVSANLDSSGTIRVDHGTLSLDGGNDLLDGTIAGGGELDLRGGGEYTLASGLALGVGKLAILDSSTQVVLSASASYGGSLTLGNFAQLALNGQSFILSGGAGELDGTVAGADTIDVQGTTDVNGLLLTGGAGLSDHGTITQCGVVNVGTGGADIATLTIARGAVYDLLGDVSINAYGSASIDNAGLLAKLAASGTSIIRGSFANSGTIQVDMGTLGLVGPTGSLGGTLAGSGEIDLRGGGNYVLDAAIVVSVATLGILDLGTTVRLGANLTDPGGFTLGSGASLVLGGGDFVLAGDASLHGTVAGPGTLSVFGTADVHGLLLAGTTELDDYGFITQSGPLSIGSSAADSTLLMIEPGAIYDLVGDDPIVGAGAATIVNAGLFAKIGGGGLSTVSADVTNTGTIAVSRGTLAFTALTNAGAIVVGGSGADATVVVAAALVAGGAVGTIWIGSGGTVVLDAGVAAGESIAFAGRQAVLALAEPGGVAAAISGFAVGDTIDLVGIAANGLTYANGWLGITETSNGTLTNIASLDLPGIANPAGLALVADGHGGTAIEFAPSTNPPGTIVADNWTAAGGNWSNAANWVAASGPPSVVPGAGNDAVIAPTGTAGFVVSYNATDTVWQLNGGTVSSGAAIALLIGGGALTVTDGGSWSGAIVETAGTFDAISGFSIGGLVLGVAAVAEIDSGILSISSGTLAGEMLGAGEVSLIGPGQFTLQAGLSITVATLDLGVRGGLGANVTLVSCSANID